MSTAASVTIPYQEFETMQRARTEAGLKIAELEAQIKSGEIKASDAALLAMAHAGIEIARYAVASLPAESNKDWPVTALRTIAANLPMLPGASTDEESLATTFEYFANEIDLYEKRRRVLGAPSSAIIVERAQ